jgi:hypothetical protein
MNCDVFTERLMAYLEHDTDEPTRVAMDKHALDCGDCGPLLAELRKLRSDAAKLPELTPSRDLWQGIAARIEAPVVPIGIRERDSARGIVVVRRTWRVALIAASLVGAAGLGYLAAGARDRAPTTVAQAPIADTQLQVATVPDTATPVSAAATEPQTTAPNARAVFSEAANTRRVGEVRQAVATLNADYDREIVRLRALINERRNQLDPVTVAVIERNLQVIDAAITECKKAIAKDPSSRFLIESLNQSLQAKVELMRTAAQLPART